MDKISKYNYLVFDFDGTLVDSTNVWFNINRSVLNKYGIYDEEKIM